MLLDIGPKEDGTLDERQEKVLLDLGGWIHDHKEAVFGTEKGLDYNHFLGGSTISADKKTMYLFVYDKPQETLCVKGIKTPVKRVTVLHTGEELPVLLHRFTSMERYSGNALDLGRRDEYSSVCNGCEGRA